MRLSVLLIPAVIIFLGFILCSSVLASEETGSAAHHESSLSLLPLIEPLGICALSSLLITFLTGLFRRRLGRRFMKVHLIFAILTVVIALFHGTLVLVLL